MNYLAITINLYRSAKVDKYTAVARTVKWYFEVGGLGSLPAQKELEKQGISSSYEGNQYRALAQMLEGPCPGTSLTANAWNTQVSELAHAFSWLIQEFPNAKHKDVKNIVQHIFSNQGIKGLVKLARGWVEPEPNTDPDESQASPEVSQTSQDEPEIPDGLDNYSDAGPQWKNLASSPALIRMLNLDYTVEYVISSPAGGEIVSADIKNGRLFVYMHKADFDQHTEEAA